MRKNVLLAALAVATLTAGPVVDRALAQTVPLGTAWTYQGELSQSGSPANGLHDMIFTLWAEPLGGALVGNIVCKPGVQVTNGRFSTQLDFGALPAAQGLFLQIEVRPTTGRACNDGTDLVALLPRQQLTPTPYALSAVSAGTAGVATNAQQLGGQPAAFYTSASNLSSGTIPSDRLSGTYAGAVSFSNTGNAFAGSGAGLTGLNASTLASGTVPGARLSGSYTLPVTFSNASNNFAGSGAGLTGLNASNLASGTLPDARLSGTYTGLLNLQNVGNAFTGQGTGLTALNASNLASGTLPDARLSGTYNSQLTFSNGANYFGGSGAGLTGLNASSLSTGTVPDARLGANLARTDLANTFNAVNTFNGNIVGANLGLGVVPSFRLHVLDTSALAASIESSNALGTWLNLRNTSAGGVYWRLISTGSGNGEGAGKLILGYGTVAGTNALNAMVLQSNGNIGVGTNTPGAPLDVGGRAQLLTTANGASEGAVFTRRSDSTLSGIITGYPASASAPLGGNQIVIVNAAGTTLTAGLSTNYATFTSTVFGTVKSFVEPHPARPEADIYYAAIEGPEAAMYARGTATLTGGRATVTLPEHFTALASARGLTVILTPLSEESLGLAVVNKSTSSFEVRELLKGTGSYEFDWEIKAVRAARQDFQVIRPWTDRRVNDAAISDEKAWADRLDEVRSINQRTAELERAPR
jgi:hypothetical protein